MKPDIKQLRILFTEKDICLPLRHCGADDISVNWEIDSIVKNRGFFESLYSDYPLTGVYDRDTFWYYFLTEKISGMSGLCNYLDNDDAELLRLLSGQAGDALSKTTPEAVQYIKENAEEIFSDPEPEQDPELQYSAADFIIRNQKDFITRTQEGISSPVFKTLCRRQPHLIVSRFVDLRQIFTDYPELFSLLFRDRSLQDFLDIGLDDVLDAWREEFSEAYSLFRSSINRYADRLCDEAESFYESSSSEGKILKAVSILRAVRLFLKQIHHERVREFAGYARDAEQQLLKYLLAAAASRKFRIPSGKAATQKWESIDPLTVPLPDLTHQDKSADNHGQDPESYLGRSPQSYAAFKNLSLKDFLSELGDVNAENFFVILNNKDIFRDYKEKVRRAAWIISRKLSRPGSLLSDDVSMLISMLNSVSRNLDPSDNRHREAVCYSASMFCCSLTEKLLRIFYLYCSQNNILSVPKYINKQQYFSLGFLASQKLAMPGSLTIDHRKALMYFLTKIRGMKDCRSYRNKLAHWTSEMSPGSMQPDLASRLIWLFTDVLNSVYMYFVSGNSGAGRTLPSRHQSQLVNRQLLSGSVR